MYQAIYLKLKFWLVGISFIWYEDFLSLFCKFTWNWWQFFVQFSTIFWLESLNMLAFNFLVQGNIAFFLFSLPWVISHFLNENRGILELTTFKARWYINIFGQFFLNQNVPFISISICYLGVLISWRAMTELFFCVILGLRWNLTQPHWQILKIYSSILLWRTTFPVSVSNKQLEFLELLPDMSKISHIALRKDFNALALV